MQSMPSLNAFTKFMDATNKLTTPRMAERKLSESKLTTPLNHHTEANLIFRISFHMQTFAPTELSSY